MTLCRYSVKFTPDELEKLAKLTAKAEEISRLNTMRIETRIKSLDAAHRHYSDATILYHEAILRLAPDPDDDFETAFNKSRKFTAIEDDFTDASTRLNFEIREADRLGYIIKL